MEIISTIAKWYFIGCATSIIVFIIILAVDVRQRNFNFLIRTALPLAFFCSWLGVLINGGAIYTMIKMWFRKRKIKKSPKKFGG